MAKKYFTPQITVSTLATSNIVTASPGGFVIDDGGDPWSQGRAAERTSSAPMPGSFRN